MTYIDSDADMKVMISDIKSNIDIMFDYGVTCRQYQAYLDTLSLLYMVTNKIP